MGIKNIGLRITKQAIDEIADFYDGQFTVEQWTEYMHQILFNLNEHLLKNNILFMFDYDYSKDRVYDYIGTAYTINLEGTEDPISFSPELEWTEKEMNEIAAFINNQQNRFKVEAEIYEVDLDSYEDNEFIS